MLRPTTVIATGFSIACLSGAAALATAAPASAVDAASASASTTTATAESPLDLRFSHEVVVDQQRSGFEPDVAIDNGDRYYSSVPNGSSTAHSFIWRSTDHAKSFQLIPGQVVLGKPDTCPQGGGDTELQLDKKGDLFFSDLQNLTNLSNSVSSDHGKTFLTQCVSVPNSPVDRMWYAVHGNLGDPDFAIYEEYDAVASGTDPQYGDPVTGTNPTNQLVESVSHDGINFEPVFNAHFLNGQPDTHCLGGGALNCVTDDEGISGNQVLAGNGDILIAHTSSDGNGVVVSRGHLSTLPTGQTAATWTNTTLNKSLCPDKAGAAPGICGAAQFATIAKDSAGHFYVAFSSQQTTKSGTPSGPYHVYVVSSRDGKTWSKPVEVSGGGANAFSWVTAGSNGRAAVAWYHANEAKEHGSYLLDDLHHAEISVQVGESLDALKSNPTWHVSTVSEHPIKYGPLCTQGLGCTVSMGDRSLGDFLEVNHDARGALAISYVDDTSNTFTTGPTGDVAENGPAVVAKQIGGPSLVKGRVRGPGSGPAAPWGSVGDVTGDASFHQAGQTNPAGANLDLVGGAIREDAKGLVITMRAKSLQSLQVSPLAGGTTGEWITRFTTFNPGTAGNGHIYYAGMESVGGGQPRFYVGDVTPTQIPAEQISMLYDSATAIPGSVQGDTITLHVPYADIPAAKAGKTIYSATAFTATTLATTEQNPAGVLNVTDLTPPFDYRLASTRSGGGGTAATSATVSGASAGLLASATLPMWWLRRGRRRRAV
jgi:hypothetical protein